MFANKLAIETLVMSDATASEEEKNAVISALHNDGHMRSRGDDLPEVVSIAYAARFIGKPRASVYNLIRNGTLKGFYSGRNHKRATGITRTSLTAAVAKAREV